MEAHKIKVVATDIDGTLTVDRDKYEILPEVISRIHMMKALGVRTVLVTANALPVSLGLARYIGASGVVAESGCLIAFLNEKGGTSIEQLCAWPSEISIDELASVLKGFAKPSWQNDYRRCDFAFIPLSKEKAREALDVLNKHLSSKGYDKKLSTGFSGYAVHVHPLGCNKLRGLSYLLNKWGVSMGEVLAVGDSVMDVEIVGNVSLGVAVSNSDEELKKVAKYVTRHPSGFGFIEAVDRFVLFSYSKGL